MLWSRDKVSIDEVIRGFDQFAPIDLPDILDFAAGQSSAFHHGFALIAHPMGYAVERFILPLVALGECAR